MPKRVDANQPEIVQALRDAGYSVQHLHSIGKGCPDILVGGERTNILMEIKSGNAQLTPAEIDWHFYWRGQVCTVRSKEEALTVVKSQIRESDYPEPKPFHECEV